MSKDRHKNRVAHNRVDLKDREFDFLTVLYDTGRKKGRRPIWHCKCKCGNECDINSKYLLSGDTRSCGCITKGNAHNRKGYKELGESYVSHVRRAAERRGIPFEIDAKQMYERLEAQDFKCALTGVEIIVVDNYYDDRLKQSASLDRIDSNKGYTADNIHWVHKTINIMKNVLSVEEFYEWCLKVTEHVGPIKTKILDMQTRQFDSPSCRRQ